MREEKYFITNEYGEGENVTKEEYEKWSEENKDNHIFKNKEIF